MTSLRRVRSPPPAPEPLVEIAVHDEGLDALVALPSTAGELVVTAGEDGVFVTSLAARAVVRTLDDLAWPISLARSPDGGQLVALDNDGSWRAWRTDSWALTRSADAGSGGPIAVASDVVVTGHQDGAVQVWRLDTGARLHVLEAHRAQVFAIAVSSDGRRACSCSIDNHLVVWDLVTGRLARTLYDDTVGVTYRKRRWVMSLGHARRGHGSAPFTLQLVPTGDGREQLVSLEAELLAWDLSTGEDRELVPGLGGEADDLALVDEPAGGVVIARSASLELWDLVARERRAHLALAPDRHRIAALSGGRVVVGGDRTGVVRVYSLVEPRLRHRAHVKQVVAAPTPDTIATSDGDGAVYLWDLASQDPPLCLEARLREHGKPFAFVPDGRALVIGGDDGSVDEYDLRTGAWCVRSEAPGGVAVRSLCVHDASRRVLVGGAGPVLRSLALAATGGAREVLESPPLIAIGGATLLDEPLVIDLQGAPDASDDALQCTPDEPVAFPPYRPVIDPILVSDERYAIVVCALPAWTFGESQTELPNLQGWELPTQRRIWQVTATARELAYGVRPFSFAVLTKDGARVATPAGHDARVVAVHEVSTGRVCGELALGGCARAPRVIGDGRLFVVLEDDRETSVALISLPDDGTAGAIDVRVALPARKHSSPVHAIVTRDGQLVAALVDRALVWIDLASGAELERHELGAFGEALAFSADERYVVAGDGAGGVHVFAVERLAGR